MSNLSIQQHHIHCIAKEKNSALLSYLANIFSPPYNNRRRHHPRANPSIYERVSKASETFWKTISDGGERKITKLVSALGGLALRLNSVPSSG